MDIHQLKQRIDASGKKLVTLGNEYIKSKDEIAARKVLVKMFGEISQPFYGYKIIVETTIKSLGLFYLTEDHLTLKDLIFRLRDSGMNDPQIADY